MEKARSYIQKTDYSNAKNAIQYTVFVQCAHKCGGHTNVVW